jgi:hypothetical protein
MSKRKNKKVVKSNKVITKIFPKKRIVKNLPKKVIAKILPKKRIVKKLPKKVIAKILPKKRIAKKVIAKILPKKKIAKKLPKKVIAKILPKKKIAKKLPKKVIAKILPKKKIAKKLPKKVIAKKQVVQVTRKPKKRTIQVSTTRKRKIVRVKIPTYVVKKKTKYEITLAKPPTDKTYNKRIPFPDDFFYQEIPDDELMSPNGINMVITKLKAQLRNVTDKTIAAVIGIVYLGKDKRTEEQHFLLQALLHDDIIGATRELAMRTIPPDLTMSPIQALYPQIPS